MHVKRTYFIRSQTHRLVFDQFGNGEAIMGFDKGQIAQRDLRLIKRLAPSHPATVKLQNVAFGHRQEILHMSGSTETDGTRELLCQTAFDNHHRRSPIGHQ